MTTPAIASTRAGRLVRQQSGPDGYSAFVPAPLPPEPPLADTPELRRALEAAAHALGRLDGVSSAVDPDRLLYMYVRKEAVLSSQIEGTQSTLIELLTYENADAVGTPDVADVKEVSRYVAALDHGLRRIETGEQPLSLRLIREMHGVLMREGRGAERDPGEFRRTQNWIGGTRPGNARFVPPPPQDLAPVLSNFEQFLHDEGRLVPPLLKAALTHAQFETIHPFLDGNGRVGRLLVSLLFVTDRLLTRPFFYLSLYLKEHRADYYDALQRVRTHGDWEGWVLFFLVAVEAVARQATATTRALLTLFEDDARRIQVIGRAAGTAMQVYDLLRQRIVISAPRAAKELGVSWPTANAALERLASLGIAQETSGRRRDRIYTYRKQLEILERGTE